jgi:hypothetical protein
LLYRKIGIPLPALPPRRDPEKDACRKRGKKNPLYKIMGPGKFNRDISSAL